MFIFSISGDGAPSVASRRRSPRRALIEGSTTMSIDSIGPPGVARRGWASRVWRTLGARRPPGAGGPSGPSSGRDRREADRPAAEIQGMTRRLIAEDRYVFVLLKEAIGQIGESDAAPAWEAIGDRMALIPGGVIPVVRGDGAPEAVPVSAFFLDRCAVTNRQFQRFVQAGGYDDLELWPPEIWPGQARLTDRTGHPAPRGWEHGRYPAGKADHPVVCVG